MSTRREFLRRGGLAVGGLALSPLLGACTTVGAGRRDATVEETTIAALQEAMQAGRLTAESLVDIYVQRIEAIDRTGPTLRSVQEINPDARAIAAALDAERRSRGPRGLTPRGSRGRRRPGVAAAAAGDRRHQGGAAEQAPDAVHRAMIPPAAGGG